MNSERRPVIVHVVHSLEGGGTERTLVALLRRFDPSRFDHAVITLREVGSLAARLPDHVACRPLAARGKSRLTGLKLAKTVHALRPAVVHARGTGCWFDTTMAAVRTPSTRLVLGFHGLEHDAGFRRRQRWIAGWGLRAGARFTSVSLTGRRRMNRELGLPLKSIDVLSNGVDLDRFRTVDPDTRRRVRSTLRMAETAFVVGTVGSLTPVKGYRGLISAVARAAPSVPQISLLVVGSGPLRENLAAHARAERIGDRVHFTGRREDVPELLTAMDTYVCSSESEGMSNALLEAMASGRPIVATDVGDNAELVRQKVEGLIVPSGCIESLAAAITQLASTPAVRDRFAAASRARAGDHDFSHTVRAYERWYASLLPVPCLKSPSNEQATVLIDPV